MSNRADVVSWPPKSPADVLALTPKKSRTGTTSILNDPLSPSPLRTANRPTHLTPSALRRTPGAVAGGALKFNGYNNISDNELNLDSNINNNDGSNDKDDDDDDDDEDEDEELLKLKLARIEAKLKLKALQRKRKRADSVNEGSTTTTNTTTTTLEPVPKFNLGNTATTATNATTASDTNIFYNHAHSKTESAAPTPTTDVPKPRSTRPKTPPPPQIQVAASPQKQPPPSPSRVLLGLDRGLRGKDVSLKRPPSLRYPPIAGVSSLRPTNCSVNTADPFTSRPIASIGASSTGGGQPVKTFNQRIAEARAAENEKAARLAAIERSRGQGWGLSEEELIGAREEQAQSGAQLSSLEYIPPKTSIWATSTASSTTAPRPGITQPDPFMHSRPQPANNATIKPTPSSSSTITTTTASTGAGFDSFSQLHLNTRHLPHPTLSRALSQKTIYLLPDLLKTIHSPNYEPPDVEGDWVVMGVIASKSEPRQTTKSSASTVSHTNSKTNPKETGGGAKYMVMTLSDLKWDIELFLFGTGYDKFWKLSVGTVVAILNPGIMRPRNVDSGKFSLTLSSSDETVLEIGTSRDLGFCKAMKRDGKLCASWIDKRRTENCSFHVELAVKKAAGNRMELNNMGKLYSPPKKGSLRARPGFLSRGGGAGGGGGGEKIRDDGLLSLSAAGMTAELHDLPQRLGGAGGKVFMFPGKGTNGLFEETNQDAFHVGTREERLRRQLERGQRERDVAKRVVEMQKKIGGGGALSTGAEYLRKGLEMEEKKKRRDAAGGEGSGAGVDRLRPPMQNLGLSRGPSPQQSSVAPGAATAAAAATVDYSDLLSSLRDRTRISSKDIHLGPVKRRRLRTTSLSTTSISSIPPTTTTNSIEPSSTLPTQSQPQQPPGPLPTPPPIHDRNNAKNGGLMSTGSTVTPQPLKKKPKTVHFNRPVVTGGEIISPRIGGGATDGVGTRGTGGTGGTGGGEDEDDDDDLEIC